MVTCHDIYGKLYRIPAHKLTFRPSVYGIVVKRGKVLLTRIFDGYDLPGGAVEPHETIEQALKREIWEETGYKIRLAKLHSCLSTFFILPGIVRPVNSILIYYRCTKISGQLSTKNFSGLEKKYGSMAEWVDIKKLSKLKFYSSTNIPALIKKSLR